MFSNVCRIEKYWLQPENQQFTPCLYIHVGSSFFNTTLKFSPFSLLVCIYEYLRASRPKMCDKLKYCGVKRFCSRSYTYFACRLPGCYIRTSFIESNRLTSRSYIFNLTFKIWFWKIDCFNILRKLKLYWSPFSRMTAEALPPYGIRMTYE